MEIKYQFIEAENLLIQKFSGIFLLEEYIEYNEFIRPVYALPAMQKELYDYRELLIGDQNQNVPINFDWKLKQVIEISKDILKKELKDRKVKLVFWVDKPLSTAAVNLFVKSFPDQNYHFCTTGSAVVSILQIPALKNNLEYIIANLENKYEWKPPISMGNF
jgi:hypothetical protein